MKRSLLSGQTFSFLKQRISQWRLLCVDTASTHHDSPVDSLIPRIDETKNNAQEQAKWMTFMKEKFISERKNPIEHNKNDLSLFYEIDDEDRKRFFPTTIDRHLREQMKTFQAFRLMVREPGMKMIEILRQYNYDNPMLKFVMYGNRGNGKTSSMAHVMHYCGRAGFVVAHFPWIPNWVRTIRKTSASEAHEGVVNRGDDSLQWLEYFTKMNAPVLDGIKTTQSYTWTKKDTTEAGSEILSLLEFGINRVKFSDDVIIALFEELKNQTSLNSLKVLLAVDGINFLWNEAYVRFEDEDSRRRFEVKNISAFHAIMDFISSTPKNTALLSIVAEEIKETEDRQIITPKYLLGNEGFNLLEPFVPVKVGPYTDTEFENCLAYYHDRLWIQNPEAKTEHGTEQLEFLSDRNPYLLHKICAIN